MKVEANRPEIPVVLLGNPASDEAVATEAMIKGRFILLISIHSWPSRA